MTTERPEAAAVAIGRLLDGSAALTPADRITLAAALPQSEAEARAVIARLLTPTMLAEALHVADIACEWPHPGDRNRPRTCGAPDHEWHADAILAALRNPDQRPAQT